jgi:urease accessory protein
VLDVVEIMTKGSFDPNAANDQAILDHDHRLRRRIVLTTEGGAAVRLNEATPVQLRDGDGLKLADGRIVQVQARPEALLEITAHSLDELIRITWHLGNRHLPTQLCGDRLLIRHDHVIADMVHGLGGHARPVMAPFDPEGGAYASGGGGHGRHPHHDDHPQDHR